VSQHGQGKIHVTMSEGGRLLLLLLLLLLSQNSPRLKLDRRTFLAPTGLHIMSYPDMSTPWRKLTLWQSLAAEVSPAQAQPKEKQVVNLSSDGYVQTYVVLTKDPSRQNEDPYREVMFRFGSWCYAGRVQVRVKSYPRTLDRLIDSA